MYKPKPTRFIFSICARKLVEQGCLAYMAHIRDVEVEYPTIESIFMVSEFKEVFPTDCLVCLRTERSIFLLTWNLVSAPFLFLLSIWIKKK